MELPKDVHYLIVRHLPIDLRIALKVKPGRLYASEEVKKEVARMAKVANHPNKLRYTKVRTDKGVERMILVHGWHHEIYLDRETQTWHHYEPIQYYYGISKDKKVYWCLKNSNTFSPFCVSSYRGQQNIDDSLTEYEGKGGPY